MSRPVAVLAVALLAASAGCTGLFGTPGPDRKPYRVPPPATTTESPDVTVPLGPMGKRVPSLREQNRTDGGSTVVSTHERRLRAADNVTVTRTETVTIEGRTVHKRFTYRLDYEENRYWSRLVRNGRETERATTYATDEVAYHRILDNESVRYETIREPGIGEKTVGDVPVRAVEELFANRGLVGELVPNGTTVLDGHEVRRYTTRALPPYARQKFSSVTEFEVTVLVDREGVVRLFEYVLRGRTAAGERYAERSRLIVGELGNTTVTKPSWAGNATVPPSQPGGNATASRHVPLDRKPGAVDTGATCTNDQAYADRTEPEGHVHDSDTHRSTVRDRPRAGRRG